MSNAESNSHDHSQVQDDSQLQDSSSGIRGMSMTDAELDSSITTPPVLGRFFEAVNVSEPNRILDLGCGPGVAAIAMAKRWPQATVVGLDLNADPLEVAATRAAEAGVDDRVQFIQADFNENLTQHASENDLVWASMSLHHTPDPAAALGLACETLAPGGRMTLAEFGKPLTMWPERAAVVTSGTWERWQAGWAKGLEDHLGPAATNVDWPALLLANGLTDLVQFECEIHFPAPLEDLHRRWMTTHLERGLHINDGRVSAEDLTTIEGLIAADNPEGIANSTDAFVSSSRMIYTAVRPSN